MSDCGSCMAFNWNMTKEGFWGLKYLCTKFGCYRSPDQAACDGYVGDNSCYLTSACVAYKGLADDCEELKTLRYFRDTYLKSLSDGEAMINEYYTIAPKIVEKINHSVDKNDYYDYIYNQIEKCVELIKINKNKEALIIYKNMTLKLKNDFV